MQTVDASDVIHMVKKGVKLFLGRSANGAPKVKIVKGPFGLFVSRYAIAEDEFQLLKTKLDQLHH
jgi:hypothetical protein